MPGFATTDRGMGTSVWNAPPLGALMADVLPLAAGECFEIDDLTEQEWQGFVDALDE